jgi:hypothetical protein
MDPNAFKGKKNLLSSALLRPVNSAANKNKVDIKNTPIAHPNLTNLNNPEDFILNKSPNGLKSQVNLQNNLKSQVNLQGNGVSKIFNLFSICILKY